MVPGKERSWPSPMNGRQWKTSAAVCWQLGRATPPVVSSPPSGAPLPPRRLALAATARPENAGSPGSRCAPLYTGPQPPDPSRSSCSGTTKLDKGPQCLDPTGSEILLTRIQPSLAIGITPDRSLLKFTSVRALLPVSHDLCLP